MGTYIAHTCSFHQPRASSEEDRYGAPAADSLSSEGTGLGPGKRYPGEERSTSVNIFLDCFQPHVFSTFLLYLFLYYICLECLCVHACTCVCKGICHGMCVEFSRQLVGLGSPLLLCESQGSNSGCQALWPAPLPIKPYPQPMFSLDGVCH